MILNRRLAPATKSLLFFTPFLTRVSCNSDNNTPECSGLQEPSKAFILQSINPEICQIKSGLCAVHESYDAFLIDIWGVIHDGNSLYSGAYECLTQLQQTGKTVVLLSNAARRQRDVKRELEQFGIEAIMYQGIVSSGELTWQVLNQRLQEQSMPAKTAYYLGPERSRNLIDGLDLNWVDDIRKADFVLNAGAVTGNPTDTSDCEKLLQEALRIDLPMICANPDIIAIRHGKAGISAGAIAQSYAALGASHIEYFGKPYAPIYRQAFELCDPVPEKKILALGDAFATDICGASGMGIDSWLIAAGIHRQSLSPLNQNSILETAEEYVLPTFASELFVW